MPIHEPIKLDHTVTRIAATEDDATVTVDSAEASAVAAGKQQQQLRAKAGEVVAAAVAKAAAKVSFKKALQKKGIANERVNKQLIRRLYVVCAFRFGRLLYMRTSAWLYNIRCFSYSFSLSFSFVTSCVHETFYLILFVCLCTSNQGRGVTEHAARIA